MSEVIRIKLIKTVKSDFMWIDKNPLLAEKNNEFFAESNPHGAISIINNNYRLGVKPDEFEFLEAPAWVLEKHGKLSGKYNELQAEAQKIPRNCMHYNKHCKNKMLGKGFHKQFCPTICPSYGTGEQE